MARIRHYATPPQRRRARHEGDPPRAHEVEERYDDMYVPMTVLAHAAPAVRRDVFKDVPYYFLETHAKHAPAPNWKQSQRTEK